MVGDGVAPWCERAFAAREPDRRRPGACRLLGRLRRACRRGHRGRSRASRETLHALAGEGWKLAVCTNKPEAAARALLAALGLAPLFAAIGGGDSFPVRKPDPAHLLATLAAAGGDAGLAVMVGDHANDVAAARGAGRARASSPAWGYGPPAMAQGADAVAQDFPHMATIARQLLQAAG